LTFLPLHCPDAIQGHVSGGDSPYIELAGPTCRGGQQRDAILGKRGALQLLEMMGASNLVGYHGLDSL